MTLLVTIHSDDYAIVASDKKEVFKMNGVVVPHHQQAEKIVETGMGIITGSGYVDLLAAVKQRVAEEAIANTDQILEIIKEERASIEELSFYSNCQKSELLDFTCWLFSYLTIVEEVSKLRIALYHPSIDKDHFAIIEENTSKAIFPSDIEPGDVEKYSIFLSDNILKLSEIQDTNQNIEHNVKVVLELMNEISKVSETVSKTCDIGIVFKAGGMCIAKNVSVDTPSFSFQEI